LELGMD